MESQNHNLREYVVTFGDFKRIIKRYRKKIAWISAFFAFFAFLYTANKPIKYQIKASFKERGVASANTAAESSSLGVLFGGSLSPKQAEAMTWMSSHFLLKELVERLDLQGVVEPKFPPPFKFFKKMKKNLKVEYAGLRKRKVPGIEDVLPTFYLTDISYSKEEPTTFDIHYLGDQKYRLLNFLGEVVGEGTFGKRFSYEDISFVLQHQKNQPIDDSVYLIELTSADRVAEGLAEVISFETDPKDKEVVLIEAEALNRQEGAKLVNTLMDLYKESRTKEQRRISQEQISYLEERKKEAVDNLKKSMEIFAKEQSEDVASSGFITAEKALEFLAARQQEYQRRLLEIDLEVKRLKNVLKEGYVHYDRYHIDSDPAIINNLLNEIRTLNQNADSIKLSLQDSFASFDENQEIVFTNQMAESDDIRTLIAEMKTIIYEIDRDNLVEISDELLNDPRIMLKNWAEKLKDHQKEWEKSQISYEEWGRRKAQFKEYLLNLIQLFEVHEKAIYQSLAHHGDLKEEFQGIDLKLAHELFLSYNRDLNQADIQLIKYQWILNNMKDTHFELNSLMSQLDDPISKNIITSYSALLLKLQDERNLSHKEQERIKQELFYKRKFLQMHIAQSLQITQLTIDLLKSKANALQKVSLALIQQKISLLEKQLENYITNRVQNLNHERTVIEEHLKNLANEMAKIPQKKIAEQLIEQQLESSRDFGREVTHLVESKNIANNLAVVQSTPVDQAIVPLFPKKPFLLLYTALGAFVGCFFSMVGFCIKEAANGVFASCENLEELGAFVAGTISHKFNEDETLSLQDADLSLLRHLIHDLYLSGKNSCVILGAKEVDISRQLGKLASKKGIKTLIIPISFQKPSKEGEKSLLDYLEGKSDTVDICSKDEFDYLLCDGVSRYSAELITSERFKELLKQFCSAYDWVIATTCASPTSAEAKNIVNVFDTTCVILTHEHLQELEAFLLEKSRPCAFVFK